MVCGNSPSRVTARIVGTHLDLAELGRYRQLRGHAVAENAHSRFKRGVRLGPEAGPVNGVRLLRSLVPEPNRKSLLPAKSKVPFSRPVFGFSVPRRHRLGRIPIS